MRLAPDDLWAVLTIYGEARGESPAGRLGVAEVIHNRLRRKWGGATSATAVVLAPLQFSCWNPSERNRITLAQADADDPIVQDCAAAWAMAQQGSNTAGGATAYLNVEETLRVRGGSLPAWAADPADAAKVNAALVTAAIGKHTFLRL